MIVINNKYFYIQLKKEIFCISFSFLKKNSTSPESSFPLVSDQLVSRFSVLNKSICRPGPGDVSLADLIGGLRGLALENPRALLVCSSMRLLTSRFICFASMLLRLILFSMLHQYAHCNKGANKSPAEDQVYCTLQVSYLQCTWQTKFRSLPCLLLNLVVQDGNMALFRNDYNALTLKQV